MAQIHFPVRDLHVTWPHKNPQNPKRKREMGKKKNINPVRHIHIKGDMDLH